MTSFPLICYGKAPGHHDFISVNAGGSMIRWFDDWARRGLMILRNRPSFQTTFDASPTYGMQLSTLDSPDALVGIITPSRDGAGRRFPIFLGVSVPRSQFTGGGTTVCSSTTLMRRLSAIATEIIAGETSLNEVGEGAISLDHERAFTFNGMTVHGMMEGLWSRFDDPRKYLLFYNLLDIIRTLNGHVPDHFLLGIRFPLRRSQTDSDACFWMRVMQALVPIENASCFWTIGGDDAEPMLLLTLREPSSGTFTHLFDPSDDGDTICDLSRMRSETAASASGNIPDRLRQLLSDETLTLEAFLSHLPV